MKKIIISLILFLLPLFGQFGQNKVQHNNFDWFYIQTKHFDIYFTEDGKTPAEFAAAAIEDALSKIQETLNYKINNRIILIIYNSHNDFQETNTSDSYLSQGIGGFTEPFKNRMVLPFEGDYNKFRHVIHHELVHAYIQDVIYGGSIQNIISRGITLQLPLWYHEGMAEFLSSDWETMSDMFITDAIINEYLPDIQYLDGYFAYRGGQSLMRFIAEKYGIQKIGDLLKNIKENGSLEAGLKASIGLTIEELSEKWKKDVKKKYWPSIAEKTDPEDFAKKLTNNKKERGFYNSSPAISPQGDKIAFISDRDIFFDVYIMNALDGKVIKKVAESGETNDFEELNVLYPGLTWAPDNKRIALSVKSGGDDVIQIIDTDEEEYFNLPVKLKGIGTVAWSPDGDKIAFVGHNNSQSDIYVFNLKDSTLINITNDIFTDSYPAWGSKSDILYFSSDRNDYFNENKPEKDFFIWNHNYKQLDLYSISLSTNKIDRLTNLPYSNEISPSVSPDSKTLLFSSDKNGINNLYKMDLVTKSIKPITNSLYGLYELSASQDGKKLAFSSLYNSGYNIYLMNNPFDKKAVSDSLNLTSFMKSFIASKTQINKVSKDSLIVSSKFNNFKSNFPKFIFDNKVTTDTSKTTGGIFTGQYEELSEKVQDTLNVNYNKYVFSTYTSGIVESKPDSLIRFEEKLDSNGNYLVNKYKVNFSADLIYANAGYSTFYGLLGTTLLSFSDVLGNHRLIGVTSMQIDLKNSDYGLSYYYLAKRVGIGIELFHTARFLYLSRYNDDLFRFRNYGLVLSATYPINTFYRIDGGLSFINVSSENMDNISVPMEKNLFITPSLSLVHDNTFWGYYSPIEGTRYKISLFGNPGFNNKNLSFYSITFDYRKYFRFWFDNSFVVRLSGGYSGGSTPQRFMLGGTENWINRKFATGNLPIESASDFAYLSPAMPMRGYVYGERIGSKYALLNMELRVPFIRYLVTGGLPLLFQNILATVFVDAGAAWDKDRNLQFFTKDAEGKIRTKDLLIGTGTGLRSYLLFFLARLDIAWAYDGQKFTKPQYYFSIGVDF